MYCNINYKFSNYYFDKSYFETAYFVFFQEIYLFEEYAYNRPFASTQHFRNCKLTFWTLKVTLLRTAGIQGGSGEIAGDTRHRRCFHTDIAEFCGRRRSFHLDDICRWHYFTQMWQRDSALPTCISGPNWSKWSTMSRIDVRQERDVDFSRKDLTRLC